MVAVFVVGEVDGSPALVMLRRRRSRAMSRVSLSRSAAIFIARSVSVSAARIVSPSSCSI